MSGDNDNNNDSGSDRLSRHHSRLTAFARDMWLAGVTLAEIQLADAPTKYEKKIITDAFVRLEFDLFLNHGNGPEETIGDRKRVTAKERKGKRK